MTAIKNTYGYRKQLLNYNPLCFRVYFLGGEKKGIFHTSLGWFAEWCSYDQS